MATFQTAKIPFEQTGIFSALFLDYVAGKPALDGCYLYRPGPEGFRKAAAARQFDPELRDRLAGVLREQYEGLDISEAVQHNLERLREPNTFTVTTGHQLNIFTGPLFFLYKIITTVNICRQLARAIPEYHFVPVYWMGSEDHDYEEINHLYIDDRKYVWKTDQSGAVGRFSPEGLAGLAAELPGRTEVFRQAYSRQPTLARATRDFVNALLGDTGLLVLDPDHPGLKKAFVPAIRQELTEQTAFRQAGEAARQLRQRGYKAPLNARPINLFYLEDGLRERLDLAGDRYVVTNTDITFSRAEILALAEEEPEKFSPNVILRPVYQETILPNLGYVGGPSELAYWLQFRGVFEAFNTPYPVLMPRNFALYLEANAQRKLDKLGLEPADLFEHPDDLKKKYVYDHRPGVSLATQRQALEELFGTIEKQAAAFDSTLVPHIRARLQKQLNALEAVEKKMVRACKRQMEDKMRMIDWLKNYAFPGGIPQERHQNILAVSREDFLKQVMAAADPFDLRLHVLMEPPGATT